MTTQAPTREALLETAIEALVQHAIDERAGSPSRYLTHVQPAVAAAEQAGWRHIHCEADRRYGRWLLTQADNCPQERLPRTTP